MDIEMRGAVEFAGSARPDLCILLHVEKTSLASFFAIRQRVSSLHLVSVQLPEQQRTPSSPPGAGRLPLWRPSSLHVPSLSDVSSARFYYKIVSENKDLKLVESNLIFSPEGSSVGSIASCPSFVRIGSFTSRSFSGEVSPSGFCCDMRGRQHRQKWC